MAKENGSQSPVQKEDNERLVERVPQPWPTRLNLGIVEAEVLVVKPVLAIEVVVVVTHLDGLVKNGQKAARFAWETNVHTEISDSSPGS